MWFDHTSCVLHLQWKCVRWNEKQHGHEVEEVDVESVALLAVDWDLCGNCFPDSRARRMLGEGVAA